MNFIKILRELMSPFEKNADQVEENDLDKILEKVDSLLPENEKMRLRIEVNEQNADNNLQQQYFCTLLFILSELEKKDLTIEKNSFNVSQYQIIQKAFGIVAMIGIKSCLLPGVGMETTFPSDLQFPQFSQENLTDMQKYERLSDACLIFSGCFQNLSLRTVLLPYLGTVFAGLSQLSFAPLRKPESDCSLDTSASNEELKMTSDLYSSLKAEQKKFYFILIKLSKGCPQTVVLRELMILNGSKDCPKWLGVHLKKLLINRIMQPNGVLSLVHAVSDDPNEFENSWEKLDVIARLISAPHSSNPEEYYNSICSQLLDILTSEGVRYALTIANTCMSVLYENNPDVCIKKVFDKMADPFLVKPNNKNTILRTEDEVANSVELLSKSFLSSEAAFKMLPTKLLLQILFPLFQLHMKGAIFAHRKNVKKLLLKILLDETTREVMFAIFLNLESPESEEGQFGNKLSFEFGPTGGLQITGKHVDLDEQECAESLFELVQSNDILGSSLFNYLLQYLQKMANINLMIDNSSNCDTLKIIEKQLLIVNLLSRLSNTKTVQDALIKNPKPLLSFIKSLCENTKEKEERTQSGVDDFDILYVSLMVVKLLLTDFRKRQDWEIFQEFSEFLEQVKNSDTLSENVKIVMNEILELIRTHSTAQRFWDLSIDAKNENEFDKAIKDLQDPLLPVRAHGLISLTRLIRNSNPVAIAKKDLLIIIFQENLKHEDSFIYLAAINGLCALAMCAPEKVIDLLIHEFINMPERSGSGEISPEHRAKLGEILMKTTRSLGEMAPHYKNSLVNAFLCGTRDPDPLIRSSSLSCLGELCQVLGFKVGNLITEILYCIGCIVRTDKELQCRRAAVLVTTLLLRGLGKDLLTCLGSDLLVLYKGLKHLRDTDNDPTLRLHCQLALQEFDDVVQNVVFANPKLQKTIFLLHD